MVVRNNRLLFNTSSNKEIG